MVGEGSSTFVGHPWETFFKTSPPISYNLSYPVAVFMIFAKAISSRNRPVSFKETYMGAYLGKGTYWQLITSCWLYFGVMFQK